MTARITEPGVYDLQADEYHGDPVAGGSLSSTGARKLLAPSCPAAFRHWIDHGQTHLDVFDFGQAAHAEVLGVGRPIVVIDADDWRTKAAREAREAAYAADEIPLLTRDYDTVKAMAEALRRNETAAALLDPSGGRAEQTLVWRDRPTGVWRRAMLDWLPDSSDGRPIVSDYKTTASASPGAISRSVHQYGYHQQGAWYLDGVQAVTELAGREPAFVFIFQEKTPPYLITVAQLDPGALLWGRRLNRMALETYAECTATGHWPGYADQPVSLELPPYATRQLEEAWDAGEFDIATTTDRSEAA